MRSFFEKRFTSVEPALFFGLHQVWLLSEDSVSRFLLTEDSFLVSGFRQQIILVSRFVFCQQILSAVSIFVSGMSHVPTADKLPLIVG